MQSIHKLFISIAIIGAFYLIMDATLSNTRVQSRADKIMGEGFTRSLQMSDAEVNAREARGRYAEYQNLYKGACESMNHAALGNKSPKDLTPKEADCLKQVMDTHFSLTEIVRKRFSTPKPPGPVQITYNPRESGITGMDILIPNDGHEYKLTCIGGRYKQFFSKDGGSIYIGCTGVNYDKAPKSEIKALFNEDTRYFGSVLITAQNNGFNVNLNHRKIPQNYEVITGVLQLKLQRIN